MRVLSLVAVLFLASLYIYSATGSEKEGILLRETTSNPLVYFCPQDDCESLLIDYINNSNQSVHCALFDLDLDNVMRILSEKSNEIDVKLVIDNNNWDKRFSGKGIIQDTTSQLSHNKFCIFDNKIVWTGSFNPTNNGAYKNNNNIMIIESKNLANNYELEFSELWTYHFGKGQKTIQPILYINSKKYENYFCPEDNCREKVISVLNKAEKSIYFMTFSFTDFDISETLVKKNKQGIEIKGIVEAKRVNMKYNQYKNLRSKNIDVRKDANPHTMHHKVFIIDSKTTITGSYNPTKSGTTKNDENILIIHNKNITTAFLEEFNSLFITSLE